MIIKAMAAFLLQITVLENLNFDLEKSWKNANENMWELCHTVNIVLCNCDFLNLCSKSNESFLGSLRHFYSRKEVSRWEKLTVLISSQSRNENIDINIRSVTLHSKGDLIDYWFVLDFIESSEKKLIYYHYSDPYSISVAYLQT